MVSLFKFPLLLGLRLYRGNVCGLSITQGLPILDVQIRNFTHCMLLQLNVGPLPKKEYIPSQPPFVKVSVCDLRELPLPPSLS